MTLQCVALRYTTIPALDCTVQNGTLPAHYNAKRYAAKTTCNNTSHYPTFTMHCVTSPMRHKTLHDSAPAKRYAAIPAPDLTIQNHNTTMLHFAETRQYWTLPILYVTLRNFTKAWHCFTLPLPNNTTQNLCETLPRFTLPLPRPDDTRLYHYFTYELRYNLMLIHPFIVFTVSSSIGLMVLGLKGPHRYIPQYSESCHQDTVPNTVGLSMLHIGFSLTIEVLSSTVHPIHVV